MPIGQPPRGIVENPAYSTAAAKIGTQRVDEALSGIMDALSRRPDAFPLIPGWEPIRIAKTDAVLDGTENAVPALRVWFVVNSDHEVELLYIEVIEDDS